MGEVALRGERKLFWSEVEQLGQVDPIHSAFLRVSNSNLNTSNSRHARAAQRFILIIPLTMGITSLNSCAAPRLSVTARCNRYFGC